MCDVITVNKFPGKFPHLYNKLLLRRPSLVHVISKDDMEDKRHDLFLRQVLTVSSHMNYMAHAAIIAAKYTCLWYVESSCHGNSSIMLQVSGITLIDEAIAN